MQNYVGIGMYANADVNIFFCVEYMRLKIDVGRYVREKVRAKDWSKNNALQTIWFYLFIASYFKIRHDLIKGTL